MNSNDLPQSTGRTMAQRITAFVAWSNRVRLRARLAIALTIASCVAGIATYAALTESPPFGKDPTTVTSLLMLDLVLMLLLSALIIHRLVKLFVTRRRNQAGSRLHVKIVSVFTLLAVTPSIVVAVFAGLFFYFGVQAWFSDRVRTVVNESLVVAQSYLKEHQQVLRADALAMASDLNRESFKFSPGQPMFGQLVAAQASVRSLNEAIVFDGTGKILARSGLSFSLSLEPITPDMLERARKGEVVLRISDDEARVRALLRLDNFIDMYMFVGRLVEPKVLAHMTATQGAVKEYKEMEERRLNLQVTVVLIFIVAAMLLLLAAVWFGLNFAGQLVRPIGGLITAAERVRGGDLTARVHEDATDNELGLLSRAFNRMTSQLENQRSELVDANRLLDYRRRFTEAVLATVPAGVIGTDAQLHINLVNQAAAELFNLTQVDGYIGFPITSLVPELDEMLGSLSPAMRLCEGQIEVHRAGVPNRTLLVRIAAEMSNGVPRSYVVTFDDVSDLLSAQRKAAWADVARRIAHEIKNPLTPIQLSAERLRRRYLQEIKSDPEIFVSCIDTITRQVDDIGRMVDEFSAFARMPVPVIASEDIITLCRQAVFMQNTGRNDIEFVQELPQGQLRVLCDARQIAQALTNILKNAIEAIEGRPLPDKGDLPRGKITLQLHVMDEQVTLAISDNGKGLPVEDRNRLTEPYVTTRAKGTGLGLAIVKKILEDHHGDLQLDDNPAGGAVVLLTLPRAQNDRGMLGKREGIAHSAEVESILNLDLDRTDEDSGDEVSDTVLAIPHRTAQS
jgi:two-component system nitrogen regulation sensor histidine kinase NtrY